MPEETVGEIANAAKSAHPDSIYWEGLRITYLGQVDLKHWGLTPNGIYRGGESNE